MYYIGSTQNKVNMLTMSAD